MFEVNKALAYARAYVAARLINLRYIEKGNLSGVVHESAYAEDLLEFTLAVMSICRSWTLQSSMSKRQKSSVSCGCIGLH
jgi:hypothetical protein